jgi:hypothetical protein
MITSLYCCKKSENEIKPINKDNIKEDSFTLGKPIEIGYDNYVKRVLRNEQNRYKPPNNVIPDSITAVKISEIILSNIYGKDVILKEKPFTASLQEGYWLVYGQLPGNSIGGVAEIVIKKETGEIISITHGM